MRTFILSLIFTIGFSVAGHAAAPGDRIVGAAVAIDGDTLVFPDPFDGSQVRVRIFGIDAPEMGTLAGLHARGVLDDLVRFQRVVCLVETIDKYNRPVAVCSVDNIDLAEAMVRQGYAWTYRIFLIGHAKEADYLAAEDVAREARAGLWVAAPAGF